MKNTTRFFIVSLVALPALIAGGCSKPATAPNPENPASPSAQNQPAQKPEGTPSVQPPAAPAAAKPVEPVAKPTITAKPKTVAPTTIKPKAVTKTPTPTVSKVYVTITNSSFSPQVIAAKVGDTVVWVNKDSTSHTTRSDGSLLWDSGNIQPGGSYSHVFKAAGSYPYSCGIHPAMHGTVVIR